MAARDKFHETVRRSLEKDRWIITHDPLRLRFGANDVVEIDLGAERVLGAEKAGKQIAVEIKSFTGESAFYDFHAALGQFLNYRLVLDRLEPQRTLYLAIPSNTYKSLFQRDLPKASIQQYQVKIVVYDPVAEEIQQWND